MPFAAALSAPDPARALPLCEERLADGSELARYAIGYTLLELDRKHRTTIQALLDAGPAQRLGVVLLRSGPRAPRGGLEGSEYAYRQALEVTAGGSFDTDAPSLVSALLHRLAARRARPVDSPAPPRPAPPADA